MAFWDQHRSPTGDISVIPEFRISSLLDEKFDDARKTSVSGTIHGRFAILVDVIDIEVELNEPLKRRKHFLFGARLVSPAANQEHVSLESDRQGPER